MKKTFLIILLISSCYYSQAQHQISAYGGWTVSKIQQKIKSNTQQGTEYNQLYQLPILHSFYMAFKYEYHLKRFRFSTGISHTVFGTSSFFFKDTPWTTTYLNIPLMIGSTWKISKQTSLTAECGIEAGLEIGVSPNKISNQSYGIIAGVVGLEFQWKRFRLGSQLHLGLTKYRNTSYSILRHSAITTYLGYTLWDLAKAKEKKY